MSLKVESGICDHVENNLKLLDAEAAKGLPSLGAELLYYIMNRSEGVRVAEIM